MEIEMNFKPEEISSPLKEELKEFSKIFATINESTLSRPDSSATAFFIGRGMNIQTARCQHIHVPYGMSRNVFKQEFIKNITDTIFTPNGLSLITIDRRHLLLVSNDNIIGHIDIYIGGPYMGFTMNFEKRVLDYLMEMLLNIYPKTTPPIINRIRVDHQGNLNDTEVLLPTREPTPDIGKLYPYLKQTPAEVWKEFEESDSNIILLIGPPGTGKSSFILEMVNSRGWNIPVYIADQDRVLVNPGLPDYTRTMPKGSVLITEDSDKMVAKRDDGNSNMSSLLNATSGIIPSDVKIIISTNLPNLNKVDPALLRPGRTFKVLVFKPLTIDEAMDMRASMDLPMVEFKSELNGVTLAEALNWHETLSSNNTPTAVGFV